MNEIDAGTNLVGENEGQADLVGRLSISSPAEGEAPGCSPSSRSNETKRRHDFCGRPGCARRPARLSAVPIPG